jgi:hypothetical protein
MKKIIITALALSCSFSIFSLDNDGVKGSTATLTSNVGDMKVFMTKNAEGNWVLKSHLDGGRIVQRKEEEVFYIEGNRIKPISYSFNQKILFKKLKSFALFDWENKSVSYKEGKKEGIASLEDLTLGPSTAQLQLRFDFKELDLNDLPEEIVYSVYWKGETKNRIYRIMGTENIKISMGNFLSYKVERVFSEKSERSQIFWLAPELDFAVIRILNIDGRKTDIRMESFEILN